MTQNVECDQWTLVAKLTIQWVVRIGFKKVQVKFYQMSILFAWGCKRWCHLCSFHWLLPHRNWTLAQRPERTLVWAQLKGCQSHPQIAKPNVQALWMNRQKRDWKIMTKWCSHMRLLSGKEYRNWTRQHKTFVRPQKRMMKFTRKRKKDWKERRELLRKKQLNAEGPFQRTNFTCHESHWAPCAFPVATSQFVQHSPCQILTL